MKAAVNLFLTQIITLFSEKEVIPRQDTRILLDETVWFDVPGRRNIVQPTTGYSLIQSVRFAEPKRCTQACSWRAIMGLCLFSNGFCAWLLLGKSLRARDGSLNTLRGTKYDFCNLHLIHIIYVVYISARWRCGNNWLVFQGETDYFLQLTRCLTRNAINHIDNRFTITGGGYRTHTPKNINVPEEITPL